MNKNDMTETLIKPFERIANLYSQLEKTTDNYGTDTPLYPSEIHAIAEINDHPKVNLTDLAQHLGVTKGTATKIVQKLVKKNMVYKQFAPNSENEIEILLTTQGRVAAENHQEYVEYMDRQLLSMYKDVPDDALKYFISVSKKTEEFLNQLIKRRQ
ncbi:MarR family winged helix-turn-helix transcriptional regulator [Lentilactobacillus hilgardii]|uniref:MarR family winged helix-turn-helix transcriptional regulator n=1 Tax=Lentilactobacillus hilgardii TaxID=1588 RepID=UPI0039EA55DE